MRVRRLEVFGSAARGQLRPDSDIDILYDFAPEDSRVARIVALNDLLTVAFGREVDLVPIRFMGDILKRYIGDDRVVVFQTSSAATEVAG